MAITAQSTAYREGWNDGRNSARAELERVRVERQSAGEAWAIEAERRYAEGLKAGVWHATLVLAAVGIIVAVFVAAWQGSNA